MDLSPGLAQSGFELLRLIGRQGLSIEALIGGLDRIGGMPAREALLLAQSLNWIQVGGEGLLGRTAEGNRLLDAGSYMGMLRLALIDHAMILSPPWLQNARIGRNHVLSFAPVGIQQVLVEAGVAEGTDKEVVAFWDQLAALARGQRDQRLNAIGRVGERLTVERETKRTGRVPRWSAIDSNADGYDVLSVVAADDPRALSIEVKTTTMGMAGTLILTRREWETATNAPEHRFHVWDISRLGAPRLACLLIDAIEPHVPRDQGHGRWEHLEIPAAAFADQYQPV